MNKTEIITKISEVAEVSKKDVKAVIDALPDVIKDTVSDGDKVSLTGFVTFEKRHVEAKSGTVMMGDKKGETWTKPACDVIAAKLSKSYKTI
jgi:DNA-binding protein HU-beta